jgi:hypothetical protein
MVSPSKPIWVAKLNATSTMAVLVCWPFCMARPSRVVPEMAVWDGLKALRIKNNDRAILRQKSGILAMPSQIIGFLGASSAGGLGLN